MHAKAEDRSAMTAAPAMGRALSGGFLLETSGSLAYEREHAQLIRPRRQDQNPTIAEFPLTQVSTRSGPSALIGTEHDDPAVLPWQEPPYVLRRAFPGLYL